MASAERRRSRRVRRPPYDWRCWTGMVPPEVSSTRKAPCLGDIGGPVTAMSIEYMDKQLTTRHQRIIFLDNSWTDGSAPVPAVSGRSIQEAAMTPLRSRPFSLRKPRLAAMLLASLALAACDDDDDPTAPVATAQLRVVHASPDAPNVDVLVDDAAALTNVPFKAASEYLSVPSGARNLKVRAAGTSTVVIDQNATVVEGRAYTVLATGRVASIAPLVLEDDLTNPASGNIRLRLVHASPTAGNVDIYV